jgi:hypothetical protein
MPAVTGRTHRGRGGRATCRRALNAALPGDAIVLAAGATFTGNYVLPAKSGDAWITIRPAAAAPLPGVRRAGTPAYAAAMPKIADAPTRCRLSRRARARTTYRIIGVEFGLRRRTG